jgi:hypothetical protein
LHARQCKNIGALLPPELTGVALGRRAFAVLLGGALVVSTGLCVYASQSAGALFSFRTAMEISGWLWLLSVLVGFSARVARHRRHLGEVTAAATAFFTGTAMLYLSYFQWSELPAAPAAPLAVKTAPAWNPAASAPPAVVWSRSSAAAGGSAPATSRVVSTRPPEPPVVPASADVAVIPVAVEERSRRDYCAAPDDADPACPSVIPASPPQ